MEARECLRLQPRKSEREDDAIFLTMPFHTKRFVDLAESDILDLISNGIEEGREIDYKELLKIGSDGDKKEFLADVSSFANASGGHLVLGVEETHGRPTAIKPLTIAGLDAERLRIESLVRDGIAPRLAIELVAIPVTPSGYVIVLRIPRSWSGPHMVSFQHSGRFYSRNSGGKYQLDVGELRTAFTSGAQIADAIRTFRQNRLSIVVSGNTPVDLPDSAKLIIHCCPYISTALGSAVDLGKAYQQTALIRPIYGGYSHRYNLDGLISFVPDNKIQGLANSYFQLFRDGKVECVDSILLRPKERGKFIPSLPLEAASIACVGRAIALLRALDVEPPAAVMVTLLGVKSYELILDPARGLDCTLIDRDVLILAPEIADSYDVNAATLLRPSLDALWNAAGLSRCGDYDASGQPNKNLQGAMQGFW